jgi:lipoprotein-anchoring transpeptidase ErfK/SrfK
MRSTAARLVGAIAVLLIIIITSIAATSSQAPHKPRGTRARKPAHTKAPEPPPLPCGDYLGFQVLLDRQGFSPGEIDGRRGANFTHAIAALQAARRLPTTGEPDCDTWHALGGDQAGEWVATYTVSDKDLDGPFQENIPRELLQQAKLPSLAYRSPMELLGEKFHTSPALIQRMNPRLRLAAGAEIRVPATIPFDSEVKPSADQALLDLTITVTTADSGLRAVRPDGSVVFFAPVTTGSQYDPLPIGDWKVTRVLWKPVFHYNPKLFWDADPKDTRAAIKPGPNNPVGVVWIALDREHYGLHGTPEPGNVGHTESHGCVRLTNWDAARVAGLVKAGTPVQFR